MTSLELMLLYLLAAVLGVVGCRRLSSAEATAYAGLFAGRRPNRP